MTAFKVNDRVQVSSDTLNSPLLHKERAEFIAHGWQGTVVDIHEWTFSTNGFRVQSGSEYAWFEMSELTLIQERPQ